MTDMKRAENILKSDSFIEAIRCIEQAEADRIYCRHGLAHLMDVARIGRMIACEKEIDLKIDVIYAAALTHDLGRALEYSEGTHDQGSVIMAQKILPECGYNDAEIAMIVLAVAAHRMESSGMPLAELLYEADKKSRLCFLCDAADTCKWPDEKKNDILVY